MLETFSFIRYWILQLFPMQTQYPRHVPWFRDQTYIFCEPKNIATPRLWTKQTTVWILSTLSSKCCHGFNMFIWLKRVYTHMVLGTSSPIWCGYHNYIIYMGACCYKMCSKLTMTLILRAMGFCWVQEENVLLLHNVSSSTFLLSRSSQS